MNEKLNFFLAERVKQAKDKLKDLSIGVESSEHNDKIIQHYNDNVAYNRNLLFPNTFSYVLDVKHRIITDSWGCENLGFEPKSKVTFSALEDLVIDEQRALVQNDILTMICDMDGYLVESIYYISYRALEINGKIFQCSIRAKPFHFTEANEDVLSYYVELSIERLYSGDPYSSYVYYSIKKGEATEIQRIRAQTFFNENKRKIFDFYCEKTVTKEYLIYFMKGYSLKDVLLKKGAKKTLSEAEVKSITSNFNNTRKREVSHFLEKHFPECADYCNQNKSLMIMQMARIFGFNTES